MTRNWRGPGLRAIVCLAAAVACHPTSATAEDAAVPDRATAAGQDPASAAGLLPGHPSLAPTRTPEPPRVDGLLDDPIWATAARADKFVQEQPVEGAPATERTEVAFAYDRDALYVGIRVRYGDIGLMRANRTDRDQARGDDTVSIYLDPFLDQQRAYVLSTNAYGVQGDSIVQGTGDGDESWNALFETAGHRVADGWTAEMAIPFKSLRYPPKRPGERHRWGLQIRRSIQSKDEDVVWSPVSRDIPGVLRQMGSLEGMQDLSKSRNLEILPTFTAAQIGELDTDTGAFESPTVSPEVGLNVKYGLTSTLTADLTVNPEFSQIESDRRQIEVNRRFPVFFPELRPFFLEGQEIFQLPGPITFAHTRTIVDPAFGAKLSGKAGRTTLGLLFADDEAPGRLDDRADPRYGRTARSVIGRLRYDLYSESHVGVLVTDREFANTHSRLGVLDGRFRIGRNHALDVRAGATDHLDAEGVPRRGTVLDVSFRKDGRNLGYSLSHYSLDPDFRTDLGFIRRVDVRRTAAQLEYRFWPEGRVVSWGPEARYSRTYDFAGVLQDEQTRLDLGVNFRNNIRVDASIDRDMERFEGVDFWKTEFGVGGRVDVSRSIAFGGSYNAGDEIRFTDDAFLGQGRGLEAWVRVKLFSRLQSRLDVDTSRLVDPRTGLAVFDVKLYRSQTTYQFTRRLLTRGIVEYDSFDGTLGFNVLATYRVNAGTVFYLGYDDRYRQGAQLGDGLRFPASRYLRTNRAVFTKFQYLFRY
jgi:hypothetical protein